MSHLVPRKRLSLPAIAPALLAIVALSLAGCGRRGALEAPPGAPAASAATQSPAVRLAPGVGGSSARPNPADVNPLSQPARADDEPRIQPPDRPFILDAIL